MLLKISIFQKTYLSRREAKLLFFVIIFSALFSWFSAERPFGLDRDYLQYLSFFESSGNAYDGRFEIGFVWLNSLLKRLNA